MCSEEIVINILGKTYDFLNQQQVLQLKYILEDELYNYEIQPKTTDIVVYEGIHEKLALFLVSKKIEGLSLATLKSYKWHLTRFGKYINKKVEDIDTMDVRKYLAICIQSGLKKSSMATETWILRSFFSWLRREDYIVKSPMDKIAPTKKAKRLKEFLTQEELEQLRIACKTLRQKAMLNVFYSTGARLSEICALNISDIDWNNNKINVIGKGDSQRTCFLNAKAKIHLNNYLKSRTDNDEALFVGERFPHKRLGQRGFQVEFNKLGINANINKSVYAHRLRNLFATTSIQNGCSLQSVQKMMGHASPDTTLIYVNQNMDDIQTAHRRCVN